MNKEHERNPRKALGKGLSALLPARSAPPSLQIAPAEPRPVEEAHAPDDGASALVGELHLLALQDLRAGEDQPRESFDVEKLEELARSIQTNGLIQPITVSKAADGKYTIIAGERRWRAARIAGLKEIPAFVRDAERHKALELALIENLQREDLNPIEVAQGFGRLIADYGLSHEQVAERTGKDRSTVTNFLRLLRLSPAVIQEVIRGTISMGHARALLNITNPDQQFETCNDIINRKLSVRETEGLVKRLTTKEGGTGKIPAPEPAEQPVDPNVRAAIEEMTAALGTRVRIVPKTPQKGKLEIEYYSQDDLDRIYSIIVR